MISFSARVLVLAAGLMLAPVAQAEEAVTLESLKTSFVHSKAEGGTVSVLHDGWNIAFLSHDGQTIGAVIIMAGKGVTEHQKTLNDLVESLAGLVDMGNPQVMEFDGRREMALLLDTDVTSRLLIETADAFAGSPLAAMAYLLDQGYFEIHSMRDDGSLHWKTVKKSGVDLLMPMSGRELQFIEIIGRQQMHEYAAGVLADKLGLPANSESWSARDRLASKIGCHYVTYMNKYAEVLLAVTSDDRAAIGKRKAISDMVRGRNYAGISYPDQASDWPVEQAVEPPQTEPTGQTDEPPAEEVKKPMTPEEARKAYLDYVNSL